MRGPAINLKGEIIALAMLRMSNAEIAAAMRHRVSLNYISTALSRARRDGAEIPYHREIEIVADDGPMPRIYPIRKVRVDRQTLQRIRAAAHKRRVPVETFVADLLSVAASDDMFDGIMDDGDLCRSYAELDKRNGCFG